MAAAWARYVCGFPYALRWSRHAEAARHVPLQDDGTSTGTAAENGQPQTASLLYKLLTDRETNACQIWKTIDACMGLSHADLILHLFEWLFVVE